MKRIKIGVTIIVLTVGIYFIVSCGIFWLKKPSIDIQLSLSEKNNKEQPVVKSKSQVAIQSIINNNQDQLDNSSVEFVLIEDQNKPVLSVVAENQSDFIIKADVVKEKKLEKEGSYSFVTMPIPDDYKIDQETQKMLDTLIGSDIDHFVKLVLQSNNDIVSKEACRSCGMYAFFNAIKKHQSLQIDEIVVLQKLLANFYLFIEKTKDLSGFPLILLEQYSALQDLNRSQAAQNDMKLQARRAATAAALKKLQAIEYNK